MAERTCALDPRHAAARADLARLAWTTGDRGAARGHALDYLALSPDGDDAPVMAVIGRADDAADRLAAARPAAFHQVVALQILGATFPLAAAPAASGPWASLLAAHAAAARRTGAETWAALTRATQFDPDLALDHEAFIATLPDGAPFASNTLIERLGARDPAPTASGTTAAAALRPVTTHHSLGMLLLARGARDEAAACARTCATASAPPWAASLPAALAAGLDARMAFDGGEAQRALALLQSIELGPWIHLAGEVPQCGLVAERLLRAQTLTTLGQPDESRAWLTPSATLRPLEWAIGTAGYGTTVSST